jgi:hypothetical protein
MNMLWGSKRPHMHLTGAYILLVVRDMNSKGNAYTWAEIRREFVDDLPRFLGWPEYKVESQLLVRLRSLRSAGLILFDEDPSSKEITGAIKVSPTWETIYNALEVSLRALGALEREQTIVVKPSPSLGYPKSIIEKRADVFVLMPFQEDLKPVYADHITRVAQKLGLTVARADDFFAAHDIMSDIWNALNAARCIIADCTGRNPNVFYEIGLAHVIGKPVVFITKNSDDVPFDIRRFRYILYEYTPRGMEKFELSLTETLKQELRLTDSV